MRLSNSVISMHFYNLICIYLVLCKSIQLNIYLYSCIQTFSLLSLLFCLLKDDKKKNLSPHYFNFSTHSFPIYLHIYSLHSLFISLLDLIKHHESQSARYQKTLFFSQKDPTKKKKPRKNQSIKGKTDRPGKVSNNATKKVAEFRSSNAKERKKREIFYPVRC